MANTKWLRSIIHSAHPYNNNIVITGLPSIQQHRATDTNIHNIIVHVVYMHGEHGIVIVAIIL